MIGSLGGSKGRILFQTSDRKVQNFLNLKRDSEGRFTTHDVINTKPLSEFLGPGLDRLSFSMELNAYQGVSPTSIINQLRSFVRNGDVCTFILGGRNMGRYKVMSLSESYGIITNAGKVLSAKVDVSLEEYK